MVQRKMWFFFFVSASLFSLLNIIPYDPRHLVVRSNTVSKTHTSLSLLCACVYVLVFVPVRKKVSKWNTISKTNKCVAYEAYWRWLVCARKWNRNTEERKLIWKYLLKISMPNDDVQLNSIYRMVSSMCVSMCLPKADRRKSKTANGIVYTKHCERENWCEIIIPIAASLVCIGLWVKFENS